jgi:hypothetical protein
MNDTTTTEQAIIILIRHQRVKALEIESFGAEEKARVVVECSGHRVATTLRPVAGEESLLRVQVELVDGRKIRQLPRTRTRGDVGSEGTADLLEEIVGRVSALRTAEA